ncbi:acyl-CoA desaturase [Rhodocytophaga aerolata]|uniref:Acyl-CoA desaturase n=1 Tax=Rhodocytophaga aerolata TaxID=455078 RepID=A0ABT8RBT6_9BACT|nr:acyl-CoA desaturase [Rhodocytophaga aerolata]MDO1448165.1 acyl-CoA desaturase [Rhodocytophaga aerolata]
MPKVSFTHTQSPFFNILKGKVNHYFASRQLHTSGSRPLLIKSIIQVCTAITLYVWLVFFNPGVWTSVVLCILFGMNLALIGFNIMHEGGHQSFSKHKWLNETSAYFLNVLGGNAYYWKIKHNINHHTYTNIEGMDSDIDVKPFMRLNENQPRYALHRFQHLYWIGLYGISYVVWVFYHDFEKYFTGKIAANAGAYTLDAKEHTIFWVTKLAYVIVYIALPIIMLGPLQALVGFAIATFVCGTFISVVFQLAHVVEGTVFPVPNEQSNKIEDEWAIHQVKTTANFATNSKVVSWLLGGLNFQVEHHLFPKISHIHYPAINKLVKETCEEFNITYLEHASVLKAFRSHMHFIKRLGTA